MKWYKLKNGDMMVCEGRYKISIVFTIQFLIKRENEHIETMEVEEYNGENEEYSEKYNAEDFYNKYKKLLE